MDNNDQLNKVLSLIRTKNEMGAVLLCLENLSSALFSSKGQSAKDYFSRLPQALADALADIFGSKLISVENRAEVETLISQLKETIRGCEMLNMTLAFRPDEGALSLFAGWIKDHVGKNIVLEISVDRTIGAGALLIYKGTYKDYTVKKKLNSVFQLEKDTIMAMLGTK